MKERRKRRKKQHCVHKPSEDWFLLFGNEEQPAVQRATWLLPAAAAPCAAAVKRNVMTFNWELRRWEKNQFVASMLYHRNKHRWLWYEQTVWGFMISVIGQQRPARYKILLKPKQKLKKNTLVEIITNYFVASKLSKWQPFLVQITNKRYTLSFWAKPLKFSKSSWLFKIFWWF